MIKITMEVSDRSGRKVKECSVTDDDISDQSAVTELIDDLLRVVVGIGYYPASIWDAMETWVEDYRTIYGERE